MVGRCAMAAAEIDPRRALAGSGERMDRGIGRANGNVANCGPDLFGQRPDQQQLDSRPGLGGSGGVCEARRLGWVVAERRTGSAASDAPIWQLVGEPLVFPPVRHLQ